MTIGFSRLFCHMGYACLVTGFYSTSFNVAFPFLVVTPMPSFDTEGLLGIEAGGARGGHPNGEKGNQAQYNRDSYKYSGVPGFDAEEEAGDEAGESEGRADTNNDAGDGEA